MILLELLHLQGIAVVFLIAYFAVAENMIDNHYKNKKRFLINGRDKTYSLTLKCILLIVTFVSIELGVLWLHWR